jgi:type III pantothenate kinase
MNLVIDVGNSRVKIAVFNNNELIHNEIFTDLTWLNGAVEIIKNFNCSNAIISSVGNLKKVDLVKLSSKINLIQLTNNTKVPFKNAYATPKTLGVDRIALVSSAVLSFPYKNVLIIDAGTCITYDFVNSEAVYFGGAISPGLKMRYQSLHFFTKKLPLLEPSNNYSLIGDSTANSIHSGVVLGVLNEIEGVINQYLNKNKDLTVVLTGGDVNFLSNKLKNSIFANPNFLLQGLNTILTHNLQ